MHAESREVIIAFSKYLGFQIGGAEISLVNYLKANSTSQNRVIVSYCSGINTFSNMAHPLTLPKEWETSVFESRVAMKRFFYLEYLLNRSKISTHFGQLDSGTLIAQSLWAPAALLAFRGKKIRMVRDETDLGCNPNQHHGFKRLIKHAYKTIELPCFQLFSRDNRRSFEICDTVIANSHFMANKVKQIFKRECQVIYPEINRPGLIDAFNVRRSEITEEQRGVVFVGDSIRKGLLVAEELAKCFPKEKFYFFGRKSVSPTWKGNICYMPWQAENTDVFKYAKVVLAPSLCDEGYGRVPAEALALGLAVLVSNKGGLPEAVAGDSRLIANSFKEFKNKLGKLLA